MTERTKISTFYAHVNKDGKDTTEEVTGKNITLKDAKAYLEKQGYTVEKIVNAKNHHLCKYCHSIAEGTYDDLLCEECRDVFGHTLYSEL